MSNLYIYHIVHSIAGQTEEDLSHRCRTVLRISRICNWHFSGGHATKEEIELDSERVRRTGSYEGPHNPYRVTDTYERIA